MIWFLPQHIAANIVLAKKQRARKFERHYNGMLSSSMSFLLGCILWVAGGFGGLDVRTQSAFTLSILSIVYALYNLRRDVSYFEAKACGTLGSAGIMGKEVA